MPEPKDDHAVVMCRFVRDCMTRMRALTKALEVSLGPDTGELGTLLLRSVVGRHSTWCVVNCAKSLSPPDSESSAHLLELTTT
jgi:hypothetical protein